MYKEFGISDKIIKLSDEVEKEIEPVFKKINKVCEFNSLKVLTAFQKNNISDMHFNQSTGYGYGDVGRDTCEKVFADILRAEDALVRGQFISGTHALTVALFAFLRPGDTMLSITGKPYDTLDEVIGITDNPSSLKSFGVRFEKIDLINNDFDYEKIGERLRKLRKYMGLTQEQVAEILGLGRDAILRIEKGDRKIDLEELMNFSKLYNISMDELTTEEHIINSSDIVFARGFNELSEKDKKEIINLIEYKNILKSQNNGN